MYDNLQRIADGYPSFLEYINTSHPLACLKLSLHINSLFRDGNLSSTFIHISRIQVFCLSSSPKQTFCKVVHMAFVNVCEYFDVFTIKYFNFVTEVNCCELDLLELYSIYIKKKNSMTSSCQQLRFILLVCCKLKLLKT